MPRRATLAWYGWRESNPHWTISETASSACWDTSACIGSSINRASLSLRISSIRMRSSRSSSTRMYGPSSMNFMVRSTGVEPALDGFSNRCLCQLGYDRMVPGKGSAPFMFRLVRTAPSLAGLTRQCQFTSFADVLGRQPLLEHKIQFVRRQLKPRAAAARQSSFYTSALSTDPQDATPATTAIAQATLAKMEIYNLLLRTFSAGSLSRREMRGPVGVMFHTAIV
jgi:hypothetical protein